MIPLQEAHLPNHKRCLIGTSLSAGLSDKSLFLMVILFFTDRRFQIKKDLLTHTKQ